MDATDPQVRTDATPQEGPMGDAQLDGIPGTGTLKVMRGERDNVIDARGTWRLADEGGERDLEPLRRAYREGTSVSFHGLLDDPSQRNQSSITLDVRISSMSTYRYEATLDERERPGPEREVFNFHPADGLPYES